VEVIMSSRRDDVTTLAADPSTTTAVYDGSAAEAIAEMLGDALPPDWREALAIEGRQECLAGAAYAAADAALDLITVRVELRRRSTQAGPDSSPEVKRAVEALFDLDRAWRAYVHDTQRDDAAAIVYEAAEFWAGATVAALIEGALESVWEDRRQRSGG
jgi:hypothetical protein